MTEYVKHSHCGNCGTKYSELLWPRSCATCMIPTYTNPIPVAVALLRVREELKEGHRHGTVIIQRGIAPKKGEWALPGGYVDRGETWEEATAREVFEETGLVTDPFHYKLWNITSSTNRDNMLIFGELSYALKVSEVADAFKANHEVLAWDIMWEPRELAFPAHTDQARRNHFLSTKGDY